MNLFLDDDDEGEEDVSFFDRVDAAVLLGIGSPVSVSRLCSGVVEGTRDVNMFSRKGGDGWMGRDGSIGDDLTEGEHFVGIAGIGGDNFIGADESFKDDSGSIKSFLDDCGVLISF